MYKVIIYYRRGWTIHETRLYTTEAQYQRYGTLFVGNGRWGNHPNYPCPYWGVGYKLTEAVPAVWEPLTPERPTDRKD